MTPDLIALAQGGSGVALASCDDRGNPILGFGVGCRVRPDGTLRVLLGKTPNEAILVALERERGLAVTVTATRDHTSFQVKASRARIGPACSDDLPELDRQISLFRDGLVEIGYTPRQAAGYLAYDPEDLVAVELLPERVFTQTPGPGAGTELTR